MGRGLLTSIFLGGTLILFLSSIFIVDERQKALVLQFGQIKSVKENPGLAFKLPFIQDVVRYDDRILSLDTCLLYTSPSPRDQRGSRMPSSA